MDAATEAKYRANLLRDYDRLIRDFEEALPRCGDTMLMFFTHDELRLILAALRTARGSALVGRTELTR